MWPILLLLNQPHFSMTSQSVCDWIYKKGLIRTCDYLEILYVFEILKSFQERTATEQLVCISPLICSHPRLLIDGLFNGQLVNACCLFRQFYFLWSISQVPLQGWQVAAMKWQGFFQKSYMAKWYQFRPFSAPHIT